MSVNLYLISCVTRKYAKEKRLVALSVLKSQKNISDISETVKCVVFEVGQLSNLKLNLNFVILLCFQILG